ncbi:unnamed protein product [Pipistrellus nathusii]|uniref:Uncharacterized protein n=1 Tax=Pipistrellus nathusii TaxID=59473 RepID=A0ABN9Z291_PIPNA
MPGAGVFWKQYRAVRSGLLPRPPARRGCRPCPRPPRPAAARRAPGVREPHGPGSRLRGEAGRGVALRAFLSFPIASGRQAPESSSRWTLARSPGTTTRRPTLSPGVTQVCCE